MVNIQPIISEAFELCVKECKKHKNIEKIKEDVLTPMIDHIIHKLRPYIIGTVFFMVSIVILIVLVLYKLVIVN
jgi:hypothetical protein